MFFILITYVRYSRPVGLWTFHRIIDDFFDDDDGYWAGRRCGLDERAKEACGSPPVDILAYEGFLMYYKGQVLAVRQACEVSVHPSLEMQLFMNAVSYPMKTFKYSAIWAPKMTPRLSWNQALKFIVVERISQLAEYGRQD